MYWGIETSRDSKWGRIDVNPTERLWSQHLWSGLESKKSWVWLPLAFAQLASKQKNSCPHFPKQAGQSLNRELCWLGFFLSASNKSLELSHTCKGLLSKSSFSVQCPQLQKKRILGKYSEKENNFTVEATYMKGPYKRWRTVTHNVMYFNSWPSRVSGDGHWQPKTKELKERKWGVNCNRATTNKHATPKEQ